jgi:hypothetical protein
MDKSGFQHSEAFLQWIWENLLFDFSSLETTAGKSVHIINPGKLNTSDGPDFKHAAVEIDGITWYGDIELHTHSTNWNAHGHHLDSNFDTVILHVVADYSSKPVYTQNGSSPHTLNLLPYLSKELHLFLKSFAQPSNLPCSSGLNFISEDAFYAQIEKAHLEYFEKKSNDFLQFYDPSLIPSKAWKKALIISLWDGLGISHNREPMRKTAESLLKHWDGTSTKDGVEKALHIAGLLRNECNLNWNLKSVRPASHPKKRIEQAVLLSALILNQNFKEFLNQDATELWLSWLKESAISNSSRMKILYGTVFLPSLFLLGKLFAYQALSEASLSAWKHLKTPIPSSLLKKFASLDVSNPAYRKKLGAVHQLKTYCEPARCSECFVLKKAIQS